MRKARAARDIPPPLELACLTALWALGQGSVKDVRRAVAANHPLAYTTVMTVLDRLARRGLITRTKASRAFVYAPTVSRDTLRRLALREFLDSYFESSQDQLLRFLQGEPSVIPPLSPLSLLSNVLDPALL
jgi:BlaI family transcriptional regulator, penicillinase repressor